MQHENGVALITGASSGIGRELAFLMAARRHPLVLVARNGARLAEIAATLRAEHGVPVWTLAMDLARPGAAREVHAFTTSNRIEVELLVNNAGVGVYGEHADADAEPMGAMLQLNVTALSDLCVLYGAEMKRRRSGRILNVASTAAYQPTPFFAAYGASKAFVLNFSEALAMEMADHGVTVSCLSPGPTDTGFFSDIDARGVDSAHFARDARDGAREVAQIGLDMMMSGSLSKIVGTRNYLRAWSGRFASRAMVARFSKGIMRSSQRTLPQ
jgi:uncharacterized protein